MDAYILRMKFPVNGLKIPVIRNNFPVSLRRESGEKSLRYSAFSALSRVKTREIRKIPCPLSLVRTRTFRFVILSLSAHPKPFDLIHQMVRRSPLHVTILWNA
jgi:hypothetical protein